MVGECLCLMVNNLFSGYFRYKEECCGLMQVFGIWYRMVVISEYQGLIQDFN